MARSIEQYLKNKVFSGNLDCQTRKPWIEIDLFPTNDKKGLSVKANSHLEVSDRIGVRRERNGMKGARRAVNDIK